MVRKMFKGPEKDKSGNSNCERKASADPAEKIKKGEKGKGTEESADFPNSSLPIESIFTGALQQHRPSTGF